MGGYVYISQEALGWWLFTSCYRLLGDDDYDYDFLD
jgi:hypothetical protein